MTDTTPPEPGTLVLVAGVGSVWQRGDRTPAIVVGTWGRSRFRVHWEDIVFGTFHTTTVPVSQIRPVKQGDLRVYGKDWRALDADLEKSL